MNLPQAFEITMRELLQDEAASFFAALDEQPPVSVRYNPHKGQLAVSHPLETLQDGRVPWADQAYYLAQRPAFTFDPCLHAGCYYVQEASSMFVTQALKVALHRLSITGYPLMALDLCAAPGGKSTLVRSLLPEDSLLVANEVVGSRARILQENLTKWGSPSVMVTQNEAADFGKLGALFDLLLVDAPCSGEGLFRKDEGAVGEWSPDAVRQCAMRQSSILRDCLPALKPGGYLIYSTCTYNNEEDEAMVQWLVEQEGLLPVPLPVEPGWGVTNALPTGHVDLPVYRFLPHKTKGEGFFLCLLQKPESAVMPRDFETVRYEKTAKQSKHVVKKREATTLIPDNVKKSLVNPDAYHWSTTKQGLIRALPVNLLSEILFLEGNLRVLQAGVTVGETKGEQFLPHPALALSTALNRVAFPVCDLDLKQAVDFLRREALVLPADCPLGWVLVTYADKALGWVKNVGNRANNNWPVEWRIRSNNPFA